MTVKEIELQIIKLATSLTASEVTLKNVQDNFLDAREANTKLVGELKKAIAEHQAEAAGLNVRLSLAEKEITDLKVIVERGRSFRWALAATLISVVLSSTLSAVIAY